MININEKYLNNISDIYSLLEDNNLLLLFNNINDKYISINSHLIHKESKISLKDNFIFNLDNYISFLKEYIFINQFELRYIISLTLNNKNIKYLLINKYYYDDLDYYQKLFIKIFMNNYKKNIKYLNKITNIKELNFKELVDIINNKKRTHCLFEKINKNNVNYYLNIINTIID